MTNLQEVTDQALNLLPTDRIDLVERILESVDGFVDPQLENHWRGIAVRRLAEHERGEISAVSAEAVHRRIREGLNENRVPSGKPVMNSTNRPGIISDGKVDWVNGFWIA